jgi:glucose-6-phosphate isomerase
LANVDPVDFIRATQGLNVEETLFLINSKTFTTAETMMNAHCCRQWILDQYALIGGKAEDQNVQDPRDYRPKF